MYNCSSKNKVFCESVDLTLLQDNAILRVIKNLLFNLINFKVIFAIITIVFRLKPSEKSMKSIIRKSLKGVKMTKSRKNVSLRVASVLTLSVLVGLALSFQACAPRSETMCVNPATNTWVKCPAGVAPGTTLENTKSLPTFKEAQTQSAQKKTTTKKRTTKKK